jgi:hypothetical protein
MLYVVEVECDKLICVCDVQTIDFVNQVELFC